MPRITLALGGLLIVIGIVGFAATGAESMTALIPVIPGVLFEALGGIGLVGGQVRKHAMHAAVALALLTALVMIQPLVMRWDEAGTAALTSIVLVIVLCLAYVGVGVNSFIQARRARQNEADGA